MKQIVGLDKYMQILAYERIPIGIAAVYSETLSYLPSG